MSVTFAFVAMLVVMAVTSFVMVRRILWERRVRLTCERMAEDLWVLLAATCDERGGDSALAERVRETLELAYAEGLAYEDTRRRAEALEAELS
jgi:hypothetical protein